MALLHGRAGRLTAQTGVFRSGQAPSLGPLDVDGDGKTAAVNLKVLAHFEELQAAVRSLGFRIET